MAGYGGQTLALDIVDPNAPDYLQAQQNLADSRAQSPLKLAAMKIANDQNSIIAQDSALTLQEKRGDISARDAYLGALQSPLAAAAPTAQDQAPTPPPAIFSPAVDKAIASISPDDPAAAQKWDAALSAAADGGDKNAVQFIGRWNKNLHAGLQQEIQDMAKAAPVIQAAAAASPLATNQTGAQSPLAAGPAAPAVVGASPLASNSDGSASPLAPPSASADSAYMQWAARDPAAATAAAQSYARLQYQRTGDPNALKAMAPDDYFKVAQAAASLGAEQRSQALFVAGEMGKGAQGLLAMLAKASPADPSVIQAKNQIVNDWAQKGWITPQVAKTELANPVNPLQLVQIATEAQTVTDALTTSGQAAGNIAKAEAAARPFVPATSALGQPLSFNETTGEYTESGVGGSSSGQPVTNNGALDSFVGNLMASEAPPGNPNAANPRSSALGPGQFLEGTWLPLIKTQFPELATGKTDAQILALRTDPAVAKQATAAYVMQNAADFDAKGIPVTGASMAMAHKLGPSDAAAVLTAPPDLKLSAILSPQVMSANPQLKNQSVGDYEVSMGKQFGTDPLDTTPGNPDASGADFLKTLPPGMAAQVQQITDGRMAPPSASSRAPAAQALLRAAAQYDPTGDYTTWASRNATRKDFTSGVDSQNLTSLNTVIGHLDALNTAVDALHNGNMAWLNKGANGVQSALGDVQKQNAIKAFDVARGTVASEMVKALRGTGGAESDVQYWLKQLDSSNPPGALKTAIQQAANLIDSRIDPLRQKYQQGMGTAEDPFVTIFPHAASALARLQGDEGAVAIAAPVTGAKTPAQMTDAELKASLGL